MYMWFQRRSGVREPMVPPLDDWTSLAEGQTVLHKNADGAYYIPSGSGEYWDVFGVL